MPYCVTTALEKIQALTKRIRVVQGGTSAGKTIATMVLLIDYARFNDGKVITVGTDSLPTLRRGAMRDFLDIMKQQNLYKEEEWNRTELIYHFSNGSIIEFIQFDADKARGPRRDVLFVNEANRISWNTFTELEIRTRDFVILDFNPVNKFWAHKELIGRDDVDFLKLTYVDNEGLDDRTVNAILARKGDGTSNWWRVYGLGEIGSLEGNVYEGWQVVDEIPEGAVLKRYGCDFGFANDETGVVAVYETDDGMTILDEVLYETRLLTPELIKRLEGLEQVPIICDSARPEIIAEMQRAGLQATPCTKGNGSVNYGIEKVQERRIAYTAKSKNLEREYLTYAWRTKKTGESTGVPQDGNDHIMDALRYAVRDMAKPPMKWLSAEDME